MVTFPNFQFLAIVLFTVITLSTEGSFALEGTKSKTLAFFLLLRYLFIYRKSEFVTRKLSLNPGLLFLSCFRWSTFQCKCICRGPLLFCPAGQVLGTV